MSETLLLGAAAAVALLLVLWAQRRTRRIREQAAEREAAALARVRAGRDPVEPAGETVLAEAGLPSQLPVRSGIEVAEVEEVVDLDALLAGEPAGVADRARQRLEEPTNIALGEATLPPRPAKPVNGSADVPATREAVAQAIAARPLSANWPGAKPVPAPAAQPATPAAAVPLKAAAPAAPSAKGAAPLPERVAQAMQGVAGALPASADVLAAPAAARPAAASAAPRSAAEAAAPAVQPAAVAVSAAAAASAPRPGSRGDDVPLRELALAWFEARGYRSSPASSAVRPIELVLRHRNDPARAYAFVVEGRRVDATRVQQLRAQARSIGLLRLLIVAEAGVERGATDNSKGVRVMDRATLGSEFEQLDLSVAAKIIAVARKRATAPLH